ncbi:hypothetical protein AB0M44_24495 [Streptosporangium subroseum]|uniref:hypothetical protein n=1 Tax=Streptosporangium subroseum TaxID=106412 RepID=UPI00341ABC96
MALPLQGAKRGVLIYWTVDTAGSMAVHGLKERSVRGGRATAAGDREGGLHERLELDGLGGGQPEDFLPGDGLGTFTRNRSDTRNRSEAWPKCGSSARIRKISMSRSSTSPPIHELLC